MEKKSSFNAPGVIIKTHTITGDSVLIFDMDRYDAKAFVEEFESRIDTKPDETADSQTDIIGNRVIHYAPWGDANDKPLKMLDDIKHCGVLNGGIHAKIRLGLGRGVEPMRLMNRTADGKEELEGIIDPEIEDWIEENNIQASAYGWFYDMYALGQDVGRFVFNKGGTKIALLSRHDVSEMRLSKKDKKGKIRYAYLSGLWKAGRTWQAAEASDLITLDLLPQLGPATFLQKMEPKQRAGKQFAMVSRLPDGGNHYYSDPLWWAARDWVSISVNVPKMKAVMFENNIRLKYKVVIHQDYWETYVDGWDSLDPKEQETARNELYDQIESFLVGAKNAYKSIFIDGIGDIREGKMHSLIDIVPITDNTKPGELLPDSAAANIEILFALMMNPALMGASSFGKGYGGGAGSGSDIREATMVQIMIQEFERQSVQRKLNLVAKVNGWRQRYPNLVWRFPGMVLTTLDKGKSTQSLIAGNPAPE